MKTYYTTSQPNCIYDPEANYCFLFGGERHQQMLVEVGTGTAQLLPWPEPTYADKRRLAYGESGLTSLGWLEAIVEFLGALPNPPAKFAELWAKREAIRAANPKPSP